MLLKTASLLVIAFMVIPFTLVCCCLLSSEPFSGSPVEFRPAGLYCFGENFAPLHVDGTSSVLEFRYYIGMDRDEIRKTFAGRARLIASDTRPNKDWASGWDSLHGLAYCVLQFGGGQCTNIVTACDIYDDGQYHHVLFFDDAGKLVGAERSAGAIFLSDVVHSANESMETNGHRSVPLVDRIKLERLFYAQAVVSVAVAHVDC